MADTVRVTRRERAAARLRRELDQIEGRETDPRVEAIANATARPQTVNGSASVGEPFVGGEAARSDDQEATEDVAPEPSHGTEPRPAKGRHEV
jgi:hypothetical protein